MPSRNQKKRSKQRAEYLQKQDDILSQENKAIKPERATRPIPKRRRPLYATATRPLYATATRPIPSRKEEGLCTRQLQGRSRPEKKKASVRDSYKADPVPKRRRPLYATATRPIPKRRRPLYATATTQILNLSNLLKGSDIKRTSRRTVLLKGSDIKRTSRRTALLKGRNTRTIQLPLRHLKGIGMTPLSDWLNVLPRGSGIAGVTELPLPPKGMSWHVVLH